MLSKATIYTIPCGGIFQKTIHNLNLVLMKDYSKQYVRDPRTKNSILAPMVKTTRYNTNSLNFQGLKYETLFKILSNSVKLKEFKSFIELVYRV